MDDLVKEAMWLLKHPQFEEKPASIREFVGPGYLNIEAQIRPGLMRALVDIFGEDVNGDRIAHYEEAMVTGAIGIGKTTFASIALPYMVHWTLCLKDPQGYFNLLPGSRIAFMQMSTSEQQAKQVIFGDIKARIQHSKWFAENYPYDSKIASMFRFPKDVWVLPGDSAETTFEGYNILAGILDEMDSHKVTQDRDYADQGFDTISSRISSRFVDSSTNGHKGLIICIGQMKKGNGFAARKYAEMQQNPRAYVVRMTIWESLGWNKFLREDGTRDSFWYDKHRKRIVPDGAFELIAADRRTDLIEVPNAYHRQFKTNPEKALRDLAGIPPLTSDPFISLVDRISDCRDKWIESHGDESPVDTDSSRPRFADWFRANGDPRKRAVHLDMAYSDQGDAAGICMGHVSKVVEMDGELKPYITIDCLIRIKAVPGGEILLSDLRQIIYRMKDDFGFRIVTVTMDGFQSTDTMQQLRKKKFNSEYVSLDRSTLAYEDLREAIYDGRLEFPPYMTHLKKGDTDLVEIAVFELQQLQETPRKIDHPPGGSKDVADAMAGVVTTLMGDRIYRKGVVSARAVQADSDATYGDARSLFSLQSGATSGGEIRLPSGGGVQMPRVTGGYGISIPDRLRPSRRG